LGQLQLSNEVDEHYGEFRPDMMQFCIFDAKILENIS
jgi:hypothetical protein